MARTEKIITIPCDIGDKFWIYVPADKQAVRVECTGYVISKDIMVDRDVAYLWVNAVGGGGNWRIPFGDFGIRCFLTKREAETYK